MSIDTDIVRVTSDLAERKTIRAYRFGRYVLIAAEGTVPTPGYKVDIEPSPLRIFPQQYVLVRRKRSGIWPTVVTPYSYAELVVYPVDVDVVTVHHADGEDTVRIEEPGRDLDELTKVVPVGRHIGPPPNEAVGMSPDLKFDDAFADALANLEQIEPAHPDQMTRVEVVETGGLFGGIAGFHHLYVKVQRSTD
ncbi:hypothetical protein BH09ACT7_BH09ACT7_28040 [soil metagenome]